MRAWVNTKRAFALLAEVLRHFDDVLRAEAELLELRDGGADALSFRCNVHRQFPHGASAPPDCGYGRRNAGGDDAPISILPEMGAFG